MVKYLTLIIVMIVMMLSMRGAQSEGIPGGGNGAYQGLLNSNVLNEMVLVIVDTRTGEHTVHVISRKVPIGF